MLGPLNKLIGAIIGAVIIAGLARAGFGGAAWLVALVLLVVLLPSRSLWQRLYGGPPRHLDVTVEHRSAGRADSAEFWLMTPLDDELRRALSDVAEGSGIPGSSLRFEVLDRERVQLTSAVLGAAEAWETFARMGSRVSGVREGIALGGTAPGVVTRWRFRDAAFVDAEEKLAASQR